MTCPRCGNEWDVSKSPCGQCGLLVHLPGNLNTSRGASQSPKSSPLSSSMPAVRQRQGVTPPIRTPGVPNVPHTPPPSSMARRPMPEMQNGNGQRLPSQGPSPLTSQVSQESHPHTSSPTFSRQSTSLPSSSSNPSLPPLDPRLRSIRPSNPANAPTNNGTPANGLPRNQITTREGREGTENTGGLSLKSTPPTPAPSTRSTDQLGMSGQPLPSPLRPRRLVSENVSHRAGVGNEWAQGNQAAFSQWSQMQRPTPAEAQRPLAPGTMLRGGRYRLQALQQTHEWQTNIYETTWLAQDAQKGGAQVVLCEVVVPESNSMKVQSMLRAATIALTSAGRHPHIPTLWDVFSELGRSFFVFEPVEGESLLARMRRTGRALPEQDVIECCLQLLDVLDLLARQSPPLVHGFISPDHIVESHMRGNYILTHFSIILAGDATQLASGVDRSHLSGYTAPEFVHGAIDGRSDLYSLMATAYHAVTGSIPVPLDGIVPSAQRFNPHISSQFETVLAKGLRPLADQRYQHPAELRQALLSIRSVSGSITTQSNKNTIAPTRQPETPVRPQSSMPIASGSDDVSQLLPNMMASAILDNGVELDPQVLMPAIDELPPLEARNDMLMAGLWIAGILICLLLLVIIGRGLV